MQRAQVVTSPFSSATSSVIGITVAVLLVLAVIGLFVVIVVASRSEPDQAGRRPYAVYLFAVAFVTLFAALFATFAMVEGVVQLIGSHPGVATSLSIHPVGDAVARQVVLGGVILLVAGVTLAVHLSAGWRSAGGAPWPTTPAGRVAQTYVCAVAFVSVVTIVVAAAVAIYTICQLIAPGVFRASGGRIPPVRNLIATGYLALAAAAILGFHLRKAPEALRSVMNPARLSGGQPTGPA